MCQRISAVCVVNNAQTTAGALFPNADEIAILRISLFAVVFARTVIPMYKGNLNPDWEVYNDAAKILEECILNKEKDLFVPEYFTLNVPLKVGATGNSGLESFEVAEYPQPKIEKKGGSNV